jgi:DNA-binding XRE family transcriptional regulator
MAETEEEMRKILSNNLKKYRHDFDLTQVALAKKTGVSTNFINDIEAEKKWASLTTMVKIANVLNVRVYELLKPPNLLPDNLNSILKKYTENVQTAIGNINDILLKNEKNIPH